MDGRPWRADALPGPFPALCRGKELRLRRARTSRKSSTTPAFKHIRNTPIDLSSASNSIRDSELALKELNRVAGQPGVRAVHLPDSIERHDYIFDPGFAPVLARIEELNYPIIFHQMDGVANTFGGGRTAGPPNLAAGIDAPIEHTFLASKLIYTGTLDRYPDLQIVLPHAGGAFPYLAPATSRWQV